VCGQTNGLRALRPSPGVIAGTYYRTGNMAVRADETIITATIDIHIIIITIIIIIIIIDIHIITSIGSNLNALTIKTVVRFIPSNRRFCSPLRR
jgi:hypothetical protein